MYILRFLFAVLREFAELIENRASLEDFTMWADSVVDKCVRNVSTKTPLSLGYVSISKCDY